MNAWQCFKQIRYLLRARNWTGGSTRVWSSDSVRISPAAPDEAWRRMNFPVALIRPQEMQIDPEHREEDDLVHAVVAIDVFVAVSSDPIGESALIGGNRPAAGATGQQASQGRGLQEVEEELFAAVESLNGVEGVEIQFDSAGAATPEVADGNRYIVSREYRFNLVCTADRYYHSARRIRATNNGGGSVTLDWDNPPDRFDRFRHILRRAAGATPPASPTAGTGIALGSNLPITVTDTPGAAQFSYALFTAYDETHDTLSVEERYSAALTLTHTVT